ncbi:hypothetical protein BGX34_005649 [Mortierella sp. NVP85]|nr:hypothetical protein BGX34_005649 [Mortierella sp. NVP85]
MSTYQTDLLFVQEDRLPVVFTTLSQHDLPILMDGNLDNTPPDTPISGQRPIWGATCEQGDDESAQSSTSSSHQAKFLSVHSLATPPGSRDSTSDYDDDDDDRESAVAEGRSDVAEGSVKQLLPLDIISAHQRGARGADEDGYYDDTPLAKASPTTTTAIEIRQQAVRTLPQNTLRCVGLNVDLESGHQPWILKVIKILFYDDKVREEAVHAGNGPKYDAPRFFSFTVTSECVSMITDTYILKEFEEHELFMDMETRPLRLIQLDLHRFGLDKYGIIHSVARPLTEAGIDLLYLSTFSTANILVVEHRLADAEKILSGGTGSSGGRGQ